MNVEVLISTISCKGLRRLAASVLPQAAGLRYLVACQVGDDNPEEVVGMMQTYFGKRTDMTCFVSEGVGLSRSRNDLLARARAEIIVIGDDDIDYDADAIRKLADVFEAEASVGMVVGQVRIAGRLYGGPRRRRLHRHSLRGNYAPSCSMLIRRAALGKICFCENLGAGTMRFPSGEDDVFLYRVLSAGIRVEYVPYLFAEHTGESTAERVPSIAVLNSRGVVLSLLHRYSWPIRAVVLSWRLRTVGYSVALKSIVSGGLYACRHRGDFE